MEAIRIATAQFEHQSGNKAYNLQKIEALARKAAGMGARAVCFHECSVTGYTFARKLSREALTDLAERVPDGPSIKAMREYAATYRITILAGLFEKDDAGNLFKAFVAVDETGCIANHRKLHPFINPFLTPGNSYTTFELAGWKGGMLICYDNNIPENVRATRMLGANMIFMPHVTMCTPSPRPGAGFVDAALWEDKVANSALLRAEFDGPKGREWLMKWLPSRAYDNGVYVIFSNPIGMDDDQLKNGCSMIIDPFGNVVAECRSLDDEVVVADLSPEALNDAGGNRYLKARRPELYAGIIGQPHQSEQKVSWIAGSANNSGADV